MSDMMKVVSAMVLTIPTKEELCTEQESAMREWIITKMPSKLSTFFDQVKCPWDRSEVLLTNIKKLGYTDVILRYEYDDFADDQLYKPYFKLNTLATMLGYSRPNDLFKASGVLSNCTKYYLKSDTVPHRIAPGTGDCVIPDHLCMISDSNKYNCIYIDINACESLVASASRIPKFKENAISFKNLLADLNRISVVIINKLNQLIVDYRYQQQTQQLALLETNRKEQTQKLIAIEQDKQRLAEQQKQLEKETKLLALRKFPDTTIEKSHYGYIFSSPEYMANNLYKIGITDNLTNRERDSKTYCPTGKFQHTIASCDSRSTELTLHLALKKHGLWHEVASGNEWFYLPGLDEGINLLNMATNNTSILYEHIATYPSLLRNTFTLEAKPSILTIKDDPSIDTIIASYVNDVVKHLIDNKVTCMSKTNMILLLRKKASDPKYKKKKDRLPTELESFLSDKNIKGITLVKKSTKSSMRIKIDRDQ